MPKFVTCAAECHVVPDVSSLRSTNTTSVMPSWVNAYTFAVGEIDAETEQLLEISKASLYEGIRAFKHNNRVGDVGYAIQNYCESHGYGVVRELIGHGIGRVMHEEPEMPNYGKRGRGKKFQEGMVVAIEPMINMGT